MMMPDRKYAAETGYRYGFNGKENDNEVKSEGNQQDYGMRIYDPRLGRFLSVDPIAKQYPHLAPYQFASNRPIDGIDLDGLEFMSSGQAMFMLSEGGVKIKNQNVPSIYKDNLDRPFFDAMGVGLTPVGKYTPPSNYVEIRPAGYNALPSNSGWTFQQSPGLSGLPEDLYRYSNGTDYYAVSSGVGSIPHQGGTKFHNAAAKGGVLQEVYNYKQLFSDVRKWNASSDLTDNIDAFDKVVKAVDQTHINNIKEDSYDMYANNGFNRQDLVNFVSDGSLPSIFVSSNSIAIDQTSVRRNLDIMFHGMQIINNNHGGYTGGPRGGLFTSGTLHKIQISEETQNQYKFLINVYQFFNPDLDLTSYKELPSKLEEKRNE